MKEAMLWEKANGSIKCNLCYRRCLIGRNKTGFCGLRKHSNDKLYSLVYGKMATYAINPIEKKPFFHLHPGSRWFSFSTVGCNFRCLHCQNWEVSQAKPGDVPEFDASPTKIAQMAKDNNCIGISYTFTEPTVFFEYAYDTGKLARKDGILNNFVSNGYLTPQTIRLASEFLDAINIDLKGNAEHYRRLCGKVELENVLECIKNVYHAGLHLEIITLVIPEDNDNRDTVVQLADELKRLSKDIPWHFTRFYPCYKMLRKRPTPIETLEQMHEWAKEEGMRYVYLGNVPGHRYENTYCANCEELLIQRWGFEVIKTKLKNKRCPSCGAQIPIKGEIHESA